MGENRWTKLTENGLQVIARSLAFGCEILMVVVALILFS